MKSSDLIAVRALYTDYADAIYRYLARRVGENQAEDLLAETFRTAIDGYARFDPELGSARSWLFGIASNLLKHHWRSEQRRLRSLARMAGQMPGDPLISLGDLVAERVDAARAAERVVEVLDHLDHEDRTLLFLSGWERLNSREIGEVLGLSATAVRSRLHRLRQHLQEAADHITIERERTT